MSRRKRRNRKKFYQGDCYERFAEFSTNSVLPIIGRKDGIILCGIHVNLHSLRLRTFKKSIRCHECGIKGAFFALENFKYNKEHYENPHLNLYAYDEDGNEVLMKKDHIIPKSLGGKDRLDNMQTMCCICNGKKGNGNGRINS